LKNISLYYFTIKQLSRVHHLNLSLMHTWWKYDLFIFIPTHMYNHIMLQKGHYTDKSKGLRRSSILGEDCLTYTYQNNTTTNCDLCYLLLFIQHFLNICYYLFFILSSWWCFFLELYYQLYLCLTVQKIAFYEFENRYFIDKILANLTQSNFVRSATIVSFSSHHSLLSIILLTHFHRPQVSPVVYIGTKHWRKTFPTVFANRTIHICVTI